MTAEVEYVSLIKLTGKSLIMSQMKFYTNCSFLLDYLFMIQ